MIRRTNSIQLPNQQHSIQKNTTMNQLNQNGYQQDNEHKNSFVQNQYYSAKSGQRSSKKQEEKQIGKLRKIVSEQPQNTQVMKKSSKNINKLPVPLIQSIRKRATGKKVQGENSKKMKVSMYLSKKLKQIKENFQCQICLCQYPKQEKAQISNCQHQFCDSCLQHYVIYKVGIFEEVICPDQQCDLVMDTSLSFYKNLPQDIQKKYVKIHAFHLAAQDPNLKLCPSENCDEGILKLQQDVNPKCNVCNQTFCRLCFFKVHEGPCDKNQLDFFQNNLHYRQCHKCKNVIEKSQGCNHMTCRCGYQFCYVCGNKWTGYDHICPQNQNNNNNNQAQNNQQCCCFRIRICSCLCRILLLPLLLLGIVLVTLKFLILCLIFIVVSIFAGMFPMACQLLSEADNACIAIVMFIFFPVVMIVGIGKAISQLGCEAIGDALGQYCDELQNLLDSFCDG